jgi:hypothetical protein
VEGVVIMVSKRAGTVVVAAACVCGIVAACDSSPSAAPRSSHQAATSSASSPTTAASDVQFEAASTFSRLLDEEGIKANSVTVRGGSPFSTWHASAVARSEACHTFIAGIEHASWPANVAPLMTEYLSATIELCRRDDRFRAARTVDEFLAIPPPDPALKAKAADLQMKIEKALGIVP